MQAAERRRRARRRGRGHRKSELVDAFADAAGVPTVVARRRAVHPARAPPRRTGWPVTSWLSRLKPDPLRRLHLDLGAVAARS